MKRKEVCEIVHRELERLPSRKGRAGRDVPKNGLYFWYEEDELTHGGKQRVTRVGTHKKADLLQKRINQHFRGPREGSVFRKHLGGALMRAAGEPNSQVKAWYQKRTESPRFSDPKFKRLEQQVTEQARSASYRVLRIDDPEKRLKMEEMLIGLFSQCKDCRPSQSWLGNYAYRKQIRDSGLWNVNYVYSPNESVQSDLMQLKYLVDETLREC